MRIPRKARVPTPVWSRALPHGSLGEVSCFFFSLAPIRAQQSATEGQLVTGVRVVDESGTDVTEKLPPLPLEAGKPFDFPAERESFRDIYRMGDFSDIRVNAAA